MKTKLNKDARKYLQRLYDYLAVAEEAATDLEQVFRQQKDYKRWAVARLTANLIQNIQNKINPMAEDDDIRIV